MVAQRQIGLDDRIESISCGIFGNLPPSADRLIHGSKCSNGNQLVLGREVAIEPAVRKTNFFHKVSNTDAVKAALSKTLRGSSNDLLPVFCRQLFAYSHCRFLSPDRASSYDYIHTQKESTCVLPSSLYVNADPYQLQFRVEVRHALCPRMPGAETVRDQGVGQTY